MIVNLFGAPGSGKSTTAAGVFHKLKLAGVNAELVTEYAKDLVYEDRIIALKCQPYIFGKSLRNFERLKGKVDVIVTDSPVLLSKFYGEKYCDYPTSFYRFVVDEFLKNCDGMNFLVRRTKKFHSGGRMQTEIESDQIAGEMQSMLMNLNLDFSLIDGNPDAADIIFDKVVQNLNK
jgi:nicotinamide riboside kinase